MRRDRARRAWRIVSSALAACVCAIGPAAVREGLAAAGPAGQSERPAPAEPASLETARLPSGAAAGKRLFATGIGAAGTPVAASVGLPATSIAGPHVPCANCHGADGKGRAEGGVRPPEISWSELAKPYGHRHEGGRAHPPFDAAGFARLLRDGIDPAGQRLSPAMPRYVLTATDVDSLIAYLERIEGEHDPGVADDRLRIGTLLPRAGRQAAAGAAIEQLLREAFAEVNAGGGIHGRRLELVVADAAVAGDAPRVARQLFDEVLAVLAPFAPGLEADPDQGAQPGGAGAAEAAASADTLAALSDAAGIPVVGPLLAERGGGEGGEHVFRLLPGAIEQARTLAAFARARLAARGRDPASGDAGGSAIAVRHRSAAMGSCAGGGKPGSAERGSCGPGAGGGHGSGAGGYGPGDGGHGPPAAGGVVPAAREARAAVAVVYPETPGGRAAFAAVAAEWQGAPLRRHAYAPAFWSAEALLAALRDEAAETVFFFGSEAELGSLLLAARGLGWGPLLLASGSGFGRQAFASARGFAGPIVLAYPALPAAGGRRGDSGAGARAGVPQGVQQAALLASRVLIEALGRSGRATSRARLVAALENLFNFETGLGPPVSFGPGRRLGIAEARLVVLDPAAGTLLPLATAP